MGSDEFDVILSALVTYKRAKACQIKACHCQLLDLKSRSSTFGHICGFFSPNTCLRMNSDQEWLDKGVEFKLVDEAMIPSVVELLDESFFPDEPLFR